MRGHFIALLIAATLAASCNPKEPEHLSEEKMKEVLLDIHLAESFSMKVNQDSTRRDIERNTDSLAVFYRAVFQHHHISPAQFEQSLDWYKRNPERLDSIYTSMIPDMSKLEATYN